MRFVSVDKLEDGMILGRTILGSGGQVLLAAGTPIHNRYIDKMKRMNLTAVYVNDDFTSDVNVDEIIRPETRIEMTNKVKSFFTVLPDTDRKTITKMMREVDHQVDIIIDQVMTNRTMMVNMIDLKTYDDYTYQHSVSVCILCTVMGAALGYNIDTLRQLTLAGLFHDIGKMFVDRNILLKPGRLTSDEFAKIKEHSRLGYNFALYRLPLSNETLIGILMHHEKFNGTGYPFGREKNQISEFAQIVSICDVYDAITSNRVYHKAMLPSEAIEYIMANNDEHFSAKVAGVFLRKVAAFPVGITVELSDGRKGVVCENYEGMQLRPKVKLLGSAGREKYVNLSDYENNNITIVNILM